MAIRLPDRYLVKFMAHRPPLPRGTQLVMWSSPILLLVLVFTLTTHPTNTPHRPARSTPVTTQHRERVAAPGAATTASSATTTTVTSPHPRPARTSTTGATYAAPIASTARSFAPDVSASASRGVIVGRLTAASNVAVVPLAGPGTWSLATSVPLVAQLQCPSASSSVTRRITIHGPHDCQLELVATTTTAWSLAPRP